MLWLFGDTFIATSDAHVRRESVMVRNSIGIQQGYDPSTATMTFYWRGAGGIGGGAVPESFFPEQGEQWSWPGHGARLGDALILFLLDERAVSGGLGFESVGTRALLIDNSDDDPSAWSSRDVPLPANDFGVAVGAGGVMVDGAWVYAYSPVEPGDHDVYLVRWTAVAADAGDLSTPEWWDGAGWSGAAVPVFTGGQTEFTVHRDARRGDYVAVQTVGFGAAEVAVRTAPAPEGPWSSPANVFHPPESDRPDALVYAGKAHPELLGADEVVTYVSNNFDFATLVDDSSFYFPRFVRLTWEPTPARDR